LPPGFGHAGFGRTGMAVELESWGTYRFGKRTAVAVDAMREVLADGEWHHRNELFGAAFGAVRGDLVAATIRAVIYALWRERLVTRKGKARDMSYRLAKGVSAWEEL
jgi:hypothetical protein